MEKAQWVMLSTICHSSLLDFTASSKNLSLLPLTMSSVARKVRRSRASWVGVMLDRAEANCSVLGHFCDP